MPVVIIEGVDGSGKSTFADLIESYVPDEYTVIRQHKGPIQDDAFNEYMLPLMNVKSNEFLIADRWHIGEMIYGPLYRGKSEVQPVEQKMLEILINRIGAVKIVMQPGISTVRKRLGDRGEDFLLAEHLKEVYNFYSSYADNYEYAKVSKGTKALAVEVVDTAIDWSWI